AIWVVGAGGVALSPRRRAGGDLLAGLERGRRVAPPVGQAPLAAAAQLRRLLPERGGVRLHPLLPLGLELASARRHLRRPRGDLLGHEELRVLRPAVVALRGGDLVGA